MYILNHTIFHGQKNQVIQIIIKKHIVHKSIFWFKPRCNLGLSVFEVVQL